MQLVYLGLHDVKNWNFEMHLVYLGLHDVKNGILKCNWFTWECMM